MRTCLVALALFVALAAPAGAIPLYATDGTFLARFDSTTPGTVSFTPITGLGGGEVVYGIDMRPASGDLLALGSSHRLYRIAPATGAATRVADTIFTVPLIGTAFGADVNPVSDRVREVSNTEQNMRINPLNAAIAGNDDALNPAGNVVAVAFTNNRPGATTTTQFAIDSAAGTLVTMPTPNLGGVTPVGSLGLGTNLSQTIGFDIAPNGTAYATISTGGGISRLYTVNLTTGAATLVGQIGTGSAPFHGVTAQTDDKISFASASTSGAEGASATLTVRRVGSMPGPMSVLVNAAPGTASASDYGPVAATVDWAAGDFADKTVVVPLAADGELEGEETFTVTLSDPTGTAVAVAPNSATVTITNVAPPPPQLAVGAPLPPPVPIPPPANVRPRLTLGKLATQKLGTVLSRGLTVRASANEPCRLTADLVVSARTARGLKTPRRIARTTANLRAGALTTVRPKPSAAVRRKLRRRRTLPVSLELSCVDPGGLKSTVSRTALTLRRG